MSPFNDYITRRNVKNIMVGHFERYSFLFFLSREIYSTKYIFLWAMRYTKKNFLQFIFIFNVVWFGFSFLLHANVQERSICRSKSILLIGEYLNKSFGEKAKWSCKCVACCSEEVLLQKQIFLSCCYNLQEHWDDRRFKTVKISLWKITMKCFVRH